MCLPRGQEAELAGFFVYCTQILGWLPPLLFSILVENDVAQKYGVVISAFGFVTAIGFLSCAAPWPEIVKEAEDGGSVLVPAYHNQHPSNQDVASSITGHKADHMKVGYEGATVKSDSHI